MRTPRLRWLAVVLAAFALVAGACGDDDDGVASSGDTVADGDTETDNGTGTSADNGTGTDGAAEVPEGPTVVIGAQDFGESAILAEIYGGALEAAGYPVQQQSLGGFRDIVFTSLRSGDINFTAEYAASALEFLNDFAGEASSDVDETVAKLREQLAERDLVALEPSPAIDSNAFVVTRETAEELDLSAVSDLTEDLTLGGPPDCEENASCIPGLREVYDLDLSANFVPLDGGGPLTVAALEQGEIDVAILFSTSGVIADKDWVVLEDDKGLINADNVVPVTTEAVVEAYGDDFTDLVNRVSAALSTEELTELNRRFDVDKEDADTVAGDWLASEGFGEA